MAKEQARYELPADLTTLSDADLETHIAQATAEFDTMSDGESVPDLARYEELAGSIETLAGVKKEREEAYAAAQAQAQAIRDRVHPPAEVAAPPLEPVAATTEPVPVVTPTAPVLPAASAPQVQVVERGSVATDALVSGGLPQAARRLNPSLADVRRAAPPTVAPRRRQTAVLTASADIPGIPLASQLADMDALVAAMTARARALPVAARGDDTTWYPVASLPLEHKYTLDPRATPGEIDEILQMVANPDALVAAGGWCSPSEISYDFFNIVCEDGMLDLPSAGINRGGMRWPVSPSYNDVISGENAFFTWTETQDVAALTGTAQSGTKACSVVPCPDFDEERLRCDGLCLTVGNLMDDAYPELIANHTRLLFAGHAHRMNGLRIQALINESTAITGSAATGEGVVAPVLGALELQSIDYRERFSMCEDAVLEVVLPRWLRGAMRSDLRRRTAMGLEALEVTDARLMNFFDVLNIRVQWVTDWQSRATGFPGDPNTMQTAWPSSVQALMYAAGTFLLGRGMQLNLGVIRDSVLNETNDHTGEWMEECWLVAKIGHESRRIIINICPDGTTGANDLTSCGV